MTAVHQFVPTLAPRDAVGRHYLAIQETLRAAGYRSEIYSYEAKDEYKRLARPFTSFDGGSRGEPTWLLYHSSVGSTVADFVNARDEPLIVDYHNITPAPFFARWEPALAGALLKGRRQLATLEARAELGIADSAFNARELTELGYTTTSVVPILLDVDDLDSTPADPATVARLAGAKDGGGGDWLFVGRLAPNKAQHDIVKAFAAYRRLYDDRARLHLVGASSSHQYEIALRSFVDGLGLNDVVDITGGVTAGALTAYFDTADVYVVASEHEGFCVPLLEAMHHGVPIVAYAAAAIPETLGDAGLLLDAKDAYTIATAVHRVVTDDALRAQLVAAGSVRLREFDIDTSRRKLLDALEPVVGAPRMIIHQYVPNLEPGAVGAHTLVARDELRAAGHTSEIFTADIHPAWADRGAHLMRDVRGRADVAIYQMAIGSVVADVVLGRDDPIVVNHHNLTPMRYIAGWQPVAAHGVAWGRGQLRELAARARLGVADSTYNEHDLVDAGFTNTTVVPILLDLRTFDVEPARESTRRGAVNWLFVGRLAPNKAQHDIVKAFAAYRRFHNPDATLHLVGGGREDGYARTLARFVHALGLDDSVMVTGGVSAAELAAHYRDADVFVVCSEHEGFCVPLLEAMHHRVPIVAYAATAVPETVGEAALLFDVKDACTIAAAVDRLVRDPGLRDQLVDAGSRRLLDFDLSRTGPAFVDAVASVASSATGAGVRGEG